MTSTRWVALTPILNGPIEPMLKNCANKNFRFLRALSILQLVNRTWSPYLLERDFMALLSDIISLSYDCKIILDRGSCRSILDCPSLLNICGLQTANRWPRHFLVFRHFLMQRLQQPDQDLFFGNFEAVRQSNGVLKTGKHTDIGSDLRRSIGTSDF